MNTFSSRFSEPVPNPWPAKTPAAWRQGSALEEYGKPAERKCAWEQRPKKASEQNGYLKQMMQDETLGVGRMDLSFKEKMNERIEKLELDAHREQLISGVKSLVEKFRSIFS